MRIEERKRSRAMLIGGLAVATVAMAFVVITIGARGFSSAPSSAASDDTGTATGERARPAGGVKKKAPNKQAPKQKAPKQNNKNKNKKPLTKTNAPTTNAALDAKERELRAKEAELAARERVLRKGEKKLVESEIAEVERMIRRRELEGLRRGVAPAPGSKPFKSSGGGAHGPKFAGRCAACHVPASSLDRYCKREGSSCATSAASNCCKWEKFRKARSGHGQANPPTP